MLFVYLRMSLFLLLLLLFLLSLLLLLSLILKNKLNDKETKVFRNVNRIRTKINNQKLYGHLKRMNRQDSPKEILKIGTEGKRSRGW